eukprot:COSAG03_NODE_9717_length_698_cov_0.724541_1_plen_36_part_10
MFNTRSALPTVVWHHTKQTIVSHPKQLVENLARVPF